MPKRVLEGLAIRDSKDKTVAVAIENKKQHKRYKKMIKSKKTYLAHNEDSSIKSGMAVKIEECAPLSKRKTWVVIKK